MFDKAHFQRIFTSSLHNKYFIFLSAIIYLIFNFFLIAGHYYQNTAILSAVNILKYLVIFLLFCCLYNFYITKNRVVLIIILLSLISLWLFGFHFAYGWDSIQHVARAKYYMEHAFFGGIERHSLLYLIWGGVYAIFGESVTITHLITILFGLLGVFGIFLISRDLFDNYTAVIALLVSLTFPVFFILAKWAYLDTPYLTCIIFCFFFLLRYLNQDKAIYLFFSILCMFLASGIKESGLAVIPVAFVSLFIYKKRDLRAFIILLGAMAIILLYVYFISFSFIGSPERVDVAAEFSIVTPLNYGIQSVVMWFELLKLELLQILYSGILLLSFISILRVTKKDALLVYGIIASQFFLFIIVGLVKTRDTFSYPLIPWLNNIPYLLLFLGFIVFITAYYVMQKKQFFELDNNRLFLITWFSIFIIFFMINQKLDILPLLNLDYRYLMPAFPPLIILFAYSVTKILKIDFSHLLKYSVLILVAALVIFNTLIGVNLTFYYANSRNNALNGYNVLKNYSPSTVYTHWPFYYFPGGEVYDTGDFTWKSDNFTVRSIYSDLSPPDGYVLFGKFFSSGCLLNFNLQKFEVTSYLLNPVFPSIDKTHEYPVYVGEIPENPIVATMGFYDQESWNGVQTYWTKQDFEMNIFSQNQTNNTISFSAMGFVENKTLEIYVNDKLSKIVSVPTLFTEVQIADMFKKGKNVIRFHAQETCRRPGDIRELQTGDKRCLSIAIRNISCSPDGF